MASSSSNQTDDRRTITPSVPKNLSPNSESDDGSVVSFDTMLGIRTSTSSKQVRLTVFVVVAVATLAFAGNLEQVSAMPQDVEQIYDVPHLPMPNDTSEAAPRIVGGTAAAPGDFPGTVSLQTRVGFHFCGGTLIDEHHVLTAAHCMTDERGRLKSVGNIQIMGDDITILSTGSTQRQLRRPTHIFVHTAYNLRTMLNDVAVVRVSPGFQTTSTFRPVQIGAQTPAVNTTCTVSGWGATRENGTATAQLQRMSVAVLSHQTCNQRQSYGGAVREGMICAGTMLGGRDACQGDSGGGLICGGVVAGVVSFGYGCARPLFPGIYADVTGQQRFVQAARQWQGAQSGVPRPTTTKPSGAGRLAAGGVGVGVMVVLAVILGLV